MIINIGGDMLQLLAVNNIEKDGTLTPTRRYPDIIGKYSSPGFIMSCQIFINNLFDPSKKSNIAQTPANLFRNRSVVTMLTKFKTVKQR